MKLKRLSLSNTRKEVSFAILIIIPVIESTSKAVKVTTTLNKVEKSMDGNINSSRLSKRTPDKTLTPVMLRNGD